jgi:hypothetical protein
MSLRHDPNNPLCLSASQNLWHQKVYLNGSWYPEQSGERWASLKLYADASHMLGAEFGVRHFPNGSWTYGAGIEAPFLRVSCNLPREYDEFFQSRGTNVLVEFYMSLESISNKALFARNAPRSAPLETTKTKKNVSAGNSEQPTAITDPSPKKSSGGQSL